MTKSYLKPPEFNIPGMDKNDKGEPMVEIIKFQVGEFNPESFLFSDKEVVKK